MIEEGEKNPRMFHVYKTTILKGHKTINAFECYANVFWIKYLYILKFPLSYKGCQISSTSEKIEWISN